MNQRADAIVADRENNLPINLGKPLSIDESTGPV
jgi:hypothetical protein